MRNLLAIFRERPDPTAATAITTKHKFNDFPPEIVTLILLSALRAHTREDLIDAIPNLAQVCKSWAKILARTPEVWAFLTDAMIYGPQDEAIHRLKLWNLRAAGCPFSVNINEPNSAQQIPAERQDFWNIALGYLPRWEIVTLNMKPLPFVFQALELGNVDSLVDFRLSVGRSRSVIVDLFQRGASKLRHLQLNGLALRNWQAPFLIGLRSLSLEFCENGGPTVDDMLAILERGAPTLEDLHLSFVIFAKNECTMPPGQSFSMIHLRKITFYQLNDSALVEILQRMKAPACKDFSIEQHPRSASAAHVPSVAAFLVQSLKWQAAESRFAFIEVNWVGYITICFFSSYNVDATAEEGTDAVFRFRMTKDTHEVLASLLPILEAQNQANPSSTAYELRVRHPTSSATLLQSKQLMQANLHITTLRFETWTPERLSPVLEYLSQPDDTGSWILPHLERICIYWCRDWDVERLLTLLKCRKGAYRKRECLRVIEKVHVSGGQALERDTWKTIRALSGEPKKRKWRFN